MSTGGDVGSAQALSHELEDSGYLFARHLELLDDLVDAEILEVLDDRSHGQTGALEHPRAADLAGDALHSGALGPIDRCRANSFAPDYGKLGWPSREFTPRLGAPPDLSANHGSGSNW